MHDMLLKHRNDHHHWTQEAPQTMVISVKQGFPNTSLFAACQLSKIKKKHLSDGSVSLHVFFISGLCTVYANTQWDHSNRFGKPWIKASRQPSPRFPDNQKHDGL